MKTILTALVTSLITTTAFLSFSQSSGNVSTAGESAYDRIMAAGEIRCGYVVYPPAIIKDPNTGELSGIMVDITERLGQELGLNISWTDETSYSERSADLAADKYDVMCGTNWNLAQMAHQIDFARPLWYSGLGVWVRSDDTRFDNNIAAINDPNITIAAIDGTMPMILAQEEFPDASVYSLPAMSPYNMNIVTIETGKADVGFVEVYLGNEYLAYNPGKIRNIVPNSPLRAYANSYAVKRGEHDLRRVLDLTLTEFLQNGIVDQILDKYEKYPGSFYRVARPYDTERN